MPKKAEPNLVQISARIPADVRDKIQAMADEQHRSFSNLLAMLLTEIVNSKAAD